MGNGMTVKSENNRRNSRSVIRAFVGTLMAAVIVLGSAGAVFAADDDDDDDAPDTKFFRSLLKGLGLRRDGESGIEYRERAPLVLPNGRNLPAPDTQPVTATNPQWPVDVDVKRAKEAKSKRAKENISAAGNEQDRPELPGQLNRGGQRTASTSKLDPEVKPGEAYDRPSTPAELGTKGIFKQLWSPKEEYATFTGEPARTRLIEPPTGYRTPSAAQPYGVGKEKWVAPSANPMDRSNDIR
jgi:hypothetical protein